MRHGFLVCLACLAAILGAGEPAPPPGHPTQGPPRAWLGIALDAAASAAGGEGLVVLRVEPNSPAAVMGIKAGDRILALDGQRPASEEELKAMIAARRPGDRVELELLRPQGAQQLPQRLQVGGHLVEAPRTRLGSLGSQLAALQQRVAELSEKAREPSLAEVLARLHEIQRDLPRAAEAFKKAFPHGQFRIVISVEITSDARAQDPLVIDIGGPERAAPDAPASSDAADAPPDLAPPPPAR